MPSARDVLVEYKARWRQSTVFTGDRVFITLPTTAEVEPCNVTLPDGDRVKLEVRRRDDGLAADNCAVLDTSQEGQHHYVFVLSNGKLARGRFIVHSRRRRVKR